jgi:GH24 family phage-related lysozyme (muramidase)
MLKWNTISNHKTYSTERFELLVLLEGSTSLPYVDSVGDATIGIGFNLVYNLDPVLKAMIGGKHWSNTLRDRLEAQIGKDYSSGQNTTLRANLDRVMADWHNKHDSGVPTTFAFRNDAQITRALDAMDDYYDGRIDSWLAGIPESSERSALFSLCWNAPSMLGPKLKAAIESGDRAEAWYEIRYNSLSSSLPASVKPAIAYRRYVEADEFNLYDRDGSVRYAEAIETGQMLANHHERILGYEASYDPLKAAQIKGIETIGTIATELQPAIKAIFAKFDLPSSRHMEELLVAGKTIADVYGDGTAYDSSKNDDDLIRGTTASNTLSGGAGRDILIGLGGKDTLTGGAGSDWFVFAASKESPINSADVITDFQRGTDKIVLNKLTSGLDAHLLDKGEAFSGEGSEIRWFASGKSTGVEIDLDGDGHADMGLTLTGKLTLSDGDFLL